jgi:phage N-6-adenine-methyltransferase
MSINDGMMSSETDMWATPKDFFVKLAKEFDFTLDVCALPENAKCNRYFSPKQDGLKQNWSDTFVWMNPPYGNPEHPCKKNCKKKKCVSRGYHIDHYIPGIIDWMKKAYEESQRWGNTIVCLVPARTDTEWWHKYAMKGEIRLVEGRLKFNDGEGTAPFPSAVVIFGMEARVNTVIAI